jgi:hypothetical protein
MELLRSGRLAQAGQNGHRFAPPYLSWTSAFDRMVTFYEELVATEESETLDPRPRRWRPTPTRPTAACASGGDPAEI